MKIKICGYCGKEGPLWKAKTKDIPGLCKTCAAKEKSSPKIGDEIETGDFKGVVTVIKQIPDRSLPELIKLAQIVFNKWIKVRDTDEYGMANCISCGVRDKAVNMDAGHYYPVGSSAVLRFNEMNVHLQCVSCNRMNYGNREGYREGLVEKIGENHLFNLYYCYHNPLEITRQHCLEIIKKYKT